MTRHRFPLLLLLLITIIPASAQQQEVMISAAASLTDVLTELQPAASQEIGARVLLNFGASGALRKQIEEGAPVDVFFSAASADMDRLESKGLILRDSRRDLLSNTLVLIGDKELKNAAGLDDLRALLASAKLLAIGDPDSVPAGRYAVQALRNLGLYGIVENKRVLGGSVREVLQFVQSGSAPLGVVFSTDARLLAAGGSARKLYDFPVESLGTPINYPIAVVAATKNPQAAARLAAFLQGARAREVYLRAGFIIP
ncbi:MAG: molybdate ABC transporter substrate-binding protein [Spirochaetia bacterium]